MKITALVDRRAFLFSASMLTTMFFIRTTQPQTSGVRATDEYRDFESSDIPNLRPLGTDPAKSDEVARADRLLLQSPDKKRPIDVMRYLESLSDRNADNEAYNGGWRKRWNPLIVRFFSETKTNPAGDTTAWCAASLNWALTRCGYRGTRDASSGSFRGARGLTDTPREGDIVVFARTDPGEAGVGHGHVGLLLNQTNDAILVLGGNQMNAYGHHAVCRKWLKKRDTLLTFHSFHAITSFT
jgi:uncharacterized protein (TIGR02594 family)